ncbi:MAG TPA: YbaK/EbsC family protein [Acidiferrobacterales bacterium]|jgi:Ala-tRNA(Pro) deacylase|nr:YbaK/EbsC family protein [Acidiferrobacterales bacterium]
MAIAQTVSGYLQSHHVSYDVITHPYSDSSLKAAETAHVPPEKLAKAVILNDRRGFLMVVVPGNRHVSLDDLWRKLGRRLSLAAETRLAPVFRDCESGAIPPLGPAYGMETIVDNSLVGQPEVYFESGDHRGLIRVDGEEFLTLLRDATYGQFAH